MKAHVLTILLALLLAGTAAGPAQAVVIDFEGLPNGENAGNVLAASGVTFATGTIPNVLTPTITFTPVSASFDVFNPNICAISGTACALAHLGGTNDLLMSFSTPVTSVSLTSDDAPGEVPDVIRLLALAATGTPNQFTLLSSAQGLDDAVTSPGNQLTVTNGGLPFSFALFQTTTEQEGFDDLTFSPVPEPMTLLLWGTTMTGLGLARWRQQRRKQQP